MALNAGLAEALSKALLIGGEIEGLAIVESQPDCEGLLADADGATWSTSGWQEAVFFRSAPEVPQDSDPRCKLGNDRCRE